MVVERVEEVRLKLEAGLFRDPRVFGQRQIQVPVIGPVNSGYRPACSRVTESGEVFFKCAGVDVASTAGRIESVAAMQLDRLAGKDAWNASLAELRSIG